MEAEGVIRWEFDDMSAIALGGVVRESPVTVIGGLSWKLVTHTESSHRTGHIPSLGVYVACRYPGAKKFWRCEMKYTITLINRVDASKSKRMEHLCTRALYSNSKPVGNFRVETIENVMDDTEGFLDNDKILVEANIIIVKTIGVRIESRLRDFSEPDDTCDVCLIVENKRLHVAKAILALHSPVFKTMFYGKFDENVKKEILMPEINHEDFVAFLNVIYTSLYEMADDTVERILVLADRFNAKLVLEAVELHLMTISELPNSKKLLLSDIYKLENAQCNEDYGKFSNTLKAKIADRTVELLNPV